MVGVNIAIAQPSLLLPIPATLKTVLGTLLPFEVAWTKCQFQANEIWTEVTGVTSELGLWKASASFFRLFSPARAQWLRRSHIANSTALDGGRPVICVAESVHGDHPPWRSSSICNGNYMSKKQIFVVLSHWEFQATYCCHIDQTLLNDMMLNKH